MKEQRHTRREIADRDKVVEVIQKHQESAEWPYREESQYWNDASKLLYKRLYNGIVYPDGKKVPPPLITFDDLRNKNTLAAYSLYPDEYGMVGKITINTQWYEEKDRKMTYVLGRYNLLEILDHETIHLNQQIGRGLDPYDQRKHGHETHNKEWHKIAHSHGLQTEGIKGIHVKIAKKDSPIDLIARDLMIARPPEAENVPEGIKVNWGHFIVFGDEKKKGRSSLTKYSCPTCKLNVRIGIKDDPQLLHIPCGSVLIRADKGDVYKS